MSDRVPNKKKPRLHASSHGRGGINALQNTYEKYHAEWQSSIRKGQERTAEVRLREKVLPAQRAWEDAKLRSEHGDRHVDCTYLALERVLHRHQDLSAQINANSSPPSLIVKAILTTLLTAPDSLVQKLVRAMWQPQFFAVLEPLDHDVYMPLEDTDDEGLFHTVGALQRRLALRIDQLGEGCSWAAVAPSCSQS